MDQYFDEADNQNDLQPQPQEQNQQNQSPPQNNDPFGQIQNQPQTYNPPIQTSSDMNFEDEQFMPAEQDIVTKRIREEEEALQGRLREKADEQYQAKLKRKEEATKKYEQFLDEKEKETKSRKVQNVQSQETYRQELKNSEKYKGWQKVSLNIKTKQGEHAGRKDISRMREAILHKKEDQIGK